MSIGDNIRFRRKELDMTLEEVATLVGISRQTMSRYETGIIGNIPSDKIEALASALRTSPAYLMGWAEHDVPPLPDNILPMPKMHKIPLLGTIACGEPILAVENFDGDVDVPEKIHADFALRCKGDSMINARIFDGDIVYIRQCDSVDDGQIAAVLIDDEATLKRVHLYKDHISLEPENPQYRPIVRWGEEMNEVRIIGKAVAFTSTVR